MLLLLLIKMLKIGEGVGVFWTDDSYVFVLRFQFFFNIFMVL